MRQNSPIFRLARRFSPNPPGRSQNRFQAVNPIPRASKRTWFEKNRAAQSGENRTLIRIFRFSGVPVTRTEKKTQIRQAISNLNRSPFKHQAQIRPQSTQNRPTPGTVTSRSVYNERGQVGGTSPAGAIVFQKWGIKVPENSKQNQFFFVRKFPKILRSWK